MISKGANPIAVRNESRFTIMLLGVEWSVTGLPVTFEEHLLSLIPDPVPTRGAVAVNNRGETILDKFGSPLYHYDTNSPTYQEKVRKAESQRRLIYLWKVLRTDPTFDCTLAECEPNDTNKITWSAFAEMFLEELSKYGITKLEMRAINVELQHFDITEFVSTLSEEKKALFWTIPAEIPLDIRLKMVLGKSEPLVSPKESTESDGQTSQEKKTPNS